VIMGKRLVIESQYIRIQNIEFRNFSIVVRHQERNHWRYSHHIEILNNKFSTSDVAIYFCCNEGLIQGNTFDPAHYAIYLMHGNGNIIRENSIRNTSKYSIHIYDEDKYGSLGGRYPKIRNLLVENNMIDGSLSRSGVVISGGDYSKPPIEINGVLIRNNVIVNNSTGGITLQGDGWIKTSKFIIIQFMEIPEVVFGLTRINKPRTLPLSIIYYRIMNHLTYTPMAK